MSAADFLQQCECVLSEAKTGAWWRLPRCTAVDCGSIHQSILELAPPDQTLALAFEVRVTPRGLCSILHGMRRWYSYQTGSVARRVLEHRDALADVMDLTVPVGALRGFKVDRDSTLAASAVGDRVTLPMSRNGGCSSWTLDPAIPNRFSGATTEKAGLIVKLIGGVDVETFLAPPSRTEPWFDALYAATMGRSFRFKEEEYALRATSVDVEVMAVKL